MKPLMVRNFGGMQQLQVLDDDDLARIQDLDAARWAATSAPIRDLHCDPGFLAYVDTESKGRIRVSHVLAARDWLFARLARRDCLSRRTEELRLDDLDSGQATGQQLRAAAVHILGQAKAEQRDRITLSLVREFKQNYVMTLANGDGIVPPEVASDPEVTAFLKDIVATTGSARDLSGRSGVGEPELLRFLERARAYLAWKDKPSQDVNILCWGEETAPAVAALLALDSKIEEYFWHCDLLRQEAHSAEQLRLSNEEMKGFKSKDSAAIEKYLAESPLSAPRPDARLLLGGPVNPVYQERFTTLLRVVLSRALGVEIEELTRASWRKVKTLFAPYMAWQAEKPSEPFDKIAPETLTRYLSGSAEEQVRKLIQEDKGAADELAVLNDLEKLILYQRWLIELVNNFVNFSAIYNPKQTALVEYGTLIIDGRRLEFCSKVLNRAEHKAVAAESLMYLLYAEIRDQDGKPAAFEVVAPVTAGERGKLRVGKRGIFVDLQEREWDAQIVDVVENPISLREAIKAPFERLKNFVVKKVEDLAGSKLEAAEKSGTELTDKAIFEKKPEGAPPAPPAPPAPTAPVTGPPPAPGAPPAPAGGGVQTLLLTGSVAFAAVGSALAYIVSAISGIGFFGLLGGLAGVAGIIVLLAGFLGWLKLRRRDMSPILEASGWALNAKMKITNRLGYVFTRSPGLPKGTQRDYTDMLASFEDEAANEDQRRRSQMIRWVILLLLMGLLYVVFFYKGLDRPPVISKEGRLVSPAVKITPWNKLEEYIQKAQEEAAKTAATPPTPAPAPDAAPAPAP